jgi:hypothetical protein
LVYSAPAELGADAPLYRGLHHNPLLTRGKATGDAQTMVDGEREQRVPFALAELVLVGATWTAVYKAMQYVLKMRTAGGAKR